MKVEIEAKIENYDDSEGIEAIGMATDLVIEKVAETLGIAASTIKLKINVDNTWFALLEIERVEHLEYADVRSVQLLITDPLNAMGIHIPRNSFSLKSLTYYIYTNQSFV